MSNASSVDRLQLPYALFAIHCAVDVRAALAGYLRFSYFTA
jgi:hypothetical protein